jgi:hypothetical protein
MVLRVGVGEVGVSAIVYNNFWEEWTQVFWNLNLLAKHTSSQKRSISWSGWFWVLPVWFFQPYFQGFCKPRIDDFNRVKFICIHMGSVDPDPPYRQQQGPSQTSGVELPCIDFQPFKSSMDKQAA